METGSRIVFTKDVGGIAQINKGDTAIYLGHSQVRMESGPSKDWVFSLLITAPYEELES